MDLGVSSPQLDDASRGFSFMHNGPLDMRMDQSQTLDASEVVNKHDESDLIKIFRDYGEEKFARKIASNICKIRDEKNITSTLELADIVKKSVPYTNSRKHPATKVFQALRIEVNQELNELTDALPLLFDALKPQGRLLALTFHSLEDRIVKNFINYIVELIPDKEKKLQIMYGINGEEILTEKILDHFSGYENSKPVRIGNAAYSQKQNDIYGILMDAIHAEMKEFPSDFERSEEIWSIVKGIVWVVKNNWQKADKGIWEFRSEDQHFTFSKVLCWVAIDRAIKIANLVGKQQTALKWNPIKEAIKEDIETNAWNEEVQAYTQSYDSKYLDASVLLIEQYGFVSAEEERFKKTVKAIEKELAYNGLLYRYKNQDDFGLPSSSFTVCTFWFINSLIKIGEVEKAKKYFEDLLSYSNHLDLFSEDIDFDSKRLLGNFPQAYSHLALIDTALSFNAVKKN